MTNTAGNKVYASIYSFYIRLSVKEGLIKDFFFSGKAEIHQYVRLFNFSTLEVGLRKWIHTHFPEFLLTNQFILTVMYMFTAKHDLYLKKKNK